MMEYLTSLQQINNTHPTDMKYTNKKNAHLLNDLLLLIRKLDRTRTVQLMISNQADFSPGMYNATERERKVIKKWKKIHKMRRDRAEKLHQIAVSNANMALDLGGECSGNVTRTIIWKGKPNAKTIETAVDGGGKSNAHVIRLELAGVVEMEKYPELLACSSERGLPIIALYRVRRNPGIFQAIWVANNGGKIKSVKGWIVYDNASTLAYHVRRC